ncbi:hypothetical protein IID23_02095 [Patescibacteria group bacterium]|nr:hypothetical protein [Patescibacteria group bacterium]
MKVILSKFLIISLLVSTSLAVGTSVADAAGSIYLSPASGAIAQGSTFNVSVRVNTGGSSIDTVQANLSYPTDKLDFLGLSYSGSAFGIKAQSTGGGGIIKIGLGNLSAVNGDVLVGTITFRAKTSSGTGTVSFTSGTEADKAGKVIVSATGSATFTFIEPAPPPKPKPKDKTAPKISNIEITNLSRNSATVEWTTNENADSVVEWGPTDEYGLTVSSTKLVKKHSLNLDKRFLEAGGEYHYRIKSKDKSGNKATSEDQTFIISGIRIQIKVTDEEGNVVEGAKVSLDTIGEAITDEAGIAEFDNAIEGDLIVIVEYKGNTYSKVITVEDKDEVQEFEAKVKGVVKGGGVLGDIGDNRIIIVFIMVVLIALAGSYLFRSGGLNKLLEKVKRKEREDEK